MVNNNVNQHKNGKQVQKFSPGASGSGPKPNMGYPRMNNYQQAQQAPRYPRQNARFKGKKKYNPNVSCAHCGKTGHVIDDCYRLIGFPEDFNFTNDKTYSTPVRGNGAIMEEEDPNYYMDQVSQHMSKEQFGQFIQVMKQMKLPESATKNAGPEINANAVAGTILKYFGTCFSAFNSGTWIIDSGASEHMCFNSESFISLSTLRIPININLPNSHFITVTHIGSVQIFSDLTLHNVLYVPSFKYNLLSVHKFSSQFNYTVLFNSNNSMLQGHSMKRPQAFGEAREGLYLLQPFPKKPSASQNTSLESKICSRISSSVCFPDSVSVPFPVCSNVSSNDHSESVDSTDSPHSDPSSSTPIHSPGLPIQPELFLQPIVSQSPPR
ncbi:hypothetical protein H5410_034740 [Solanum commersonii]|uniref:CCHC-type domain-containing protein n=1 Tax=Solanum commersonii TaxID=4109 RepID=A0A9J5YSK6_SOLCO|nr:hypothetical protein H5410_034740 [Solanum commersonii]